jgi:hypothetical protein
MENRPIVPPPSQTPPPLVETVGGEPRFNIIGALLGGAVGALVAAGLWGAIVAITGWQVGLLAIGVGIIVGIAVRVGGRGVNLLHGVIAAIFALGGTVLGNLFAVASDVMRIRGISLAEVFSPSELSFVTTIFTRNFEMIDLLFYGLAIYTAFSAASREGAQGVRS